MEGSEQKSDQLSTPIELKEINSYEAQNDEFSIKMEEGEQDNNDIIDNGDNYSEFNEENFTAMNYSISQQPLLNLEQLQQP